MLVDFGNLTSR